MRVLLAAAVLAIVAASSLEARMADEPLPIEPALEEFIPAAPETRDGALSPSPFHYVFTGEDYLRVTSRCSKTGVRLAVQGRMWNPIQRRIVPFGVEHVPASDRTATSDVFNIGTGYLLNLSVFASSGAPKLNQVFVRVQVVRGPAVEYQLGTLVQGSCTADEDLGFPGSPIRSALDGGGYYRAITGTNPAAGAEASDAVPTGARWQLLAYLINLTTDATATTRTMGLRVQAAGADALYAPHAKTQTASLSRDHGWAAGLATDTAAALFVQSCPLPTDFVMTAGDTVMTFTENLQAGDNYAAPTILVREFLES